MQKKRRLLLCVLFSEQVLKIFSETLIEILVEFPNFQSSGFKFNILSLLIGLKQKYFNVNSMQISFVKHVCMLNWELQIALYLFFNYVSHLELILVLYFVKNVKWIFGDNYSLIFQEYLHSQNKYMYCLMKLINACQLSICFMNKGEPCANQWCKPYLLSHGVQQMNY